MFVSLLNCNWECSWRVCVGPRAFTDFPAFGVFVSECTS